MKETSHVVVVGAGVIGCAVAYELARRGSRVRVIDRRDVGRGATQASAGVLAPFISSHLGSPLLALGERSLQLYDEFVARVVEDSGSTVRYARAGTVEVAQEESAVETLRQAERAYRERGVEIDYLDQRQVHDAEPQLQPAVCGGLVVTSHGYVGASDLTGALRRAAGAYGVVFSLSAAVARISQEGEAMKVQTETETLDCDAVVVAAGSWSRQVEAPGDEPLPVRPVRGQLLHLGWPTTPPDHVIWTDQCYLVPWHDGSVLVGATVEDVGFDERATVAGVRSLIDLTCRLVPSAHKAWLQEVRVGLRPGTPDDMPIIGPSTRVPGLYYATGHYRNGVLLAPLTAAVTADLVLDGRRDPALELTSPARFGAS